MKKFEFKIPIYNIPLEIIFYDNVDEIYNYHKEELKRHKKTKEFVEGCDAFVITDDKGTYINFANDGKFTPGIVAHECKHAVNNIFNDLGIEVDYYNDETECYFLQYLVDLVYQCYSKTERYEIENAIIA